MRFLRRCARSQGARGGLTQESRREGAEGGRRHGRVRVVTVPSLLPREVPLSWSVQLLVPNTRLLAGDGRANLRLSRSQWEVGETGDYDQRWRLGSGTGLVNWDRSTEISRQLREWTAAWLCPNRWRMGSPEKLNDSSSVKTNCGTEMKTQKTPRRRCAPRDNITCWLLSLNHAAGEQLTKIPGTRLFLVFQGNPGLLSSSSFLRRQFVNFPPGVSSDGTFVLSDHNPAC